MPMLCHFKAKFKVVVQGYEAIGNLVQAIKNGICSCLLILGLLKWPMRITLKNEDKELELMQGSDRKI